MSTAWNRTSKKTKPFSRKDDEVTTATDVDQIKTEFAVSRQVAYTRYLIKKQFLEDTLNEALHIEWLLQSAETPLPPAFESVDAISPWMLYQVANSLRVLGEPLDARAGAFCASLRRLTAPDGMRETRLLQPAKKDRAGRLA